MSLIALGFTFIVAELIGRVLQAHLYKYARRNSTATKTQRALARVLGI